MLNAREKSDKYVWNFRKTNDLLWFPIISTNSQIALLYYYHQYFYIANLAIFVFKTSLYISKNMDNICTCVLNPLFFQYYYSSCIV